MVHAISRLVVRRLAVGVLILWLVSVVVFAGTQALSGDAATAILGKTATPQSLAILRKELHLNRPISAQYTTWLRGVVKGDLGHSLTANEPVWSLIRDRLRNTLLLTGVTIALLIPLSILVGAASAIRRFGALDATISTTALAFIAMPEFVVGMLLVLAFAVTWPVLPAVSLFAPGEGVAPHLKELVLPVATLLLTSIAYTGRMLRGSMIEALESDYVRMARLKGVPEGRVILRHAMRNALVPSIQVYGLMIGYLFGGVVVVETVFQYPGIGEGLVNAVAARDLPTVQAIGLILAAVYVIVNLVADIATVLLTPRLRTALWA